VDLSGRLEGDLVSAAATLSIPGEVTGDVLAGGSVVTLAGHAGDSVRVMASQLFVTGRVDGDLLFFGGSVQIAPGARIGGDLWVFGGDLSLGGEVAGALRVHAGRLVLTGRVGRDADVEVDAFTADPQAAIGGDLRYRARREPTTPLDPLVGGTVERLAPKKEERRAGLSVWRIAVWLVRLLGAAAVGLVALRLWPGRAAGSAHAIGREPVMAFGLGLGAGLVLPLAALLVALLSLLIGAPFAIIVWLLAAIGLYLGKLPVALWIGERLLPGGAGGSAKRPRPLALLLGVLLLYLLFATPYLGTLLWFVAAFVGLGAIVLASWRRPQVTAAPV
jgi:cytoskeletal protein CcmA (bactofilin family)